MSFILHSLDSAYLALTVIIQETALPFAKTHYEKHASVVQILNHVPPSVANSTFQSMCPPYPLDVSSPRKHFCNLRSSIIP